MLIVVIQKRVVGKLVLSVVFWSLLNIYILAFMHILTHVGLSYCRFVVFNFMLPPYNLSHHSVILLLHWKLVTFMRCNLFNRLSKLDILLVGFGITLFKVLQIRYRRTVLSLIVVILCISVFLTLIGITHFIKNIAIYCQAFLSIAWCWWFLDFITKNGIWWSMLFLKICH